MQGTPQVAHRPAQAGRVAWSRLSPKAAAGATPADTDLLLSAPITVIHFLSVTPDAYTETLPALEGLEVGPVASPEAAMRV